MAQLGFTFYDDTSTPAPTITEILAGLTTAQKLGVLNGFAEGIKPIDWRQWMKDTDDTVPRNVPRVAIRRLYEEIDAIEDWCRAEMRGERLVTPAVLDEDPESPTFGEVITPAVFNTPPTGVTGLRSVAASAFQEVFTSSQVTAVVNKMIEYSKSTKDGDFAYYSVEVKK